MQANATGCSCTDCPSACGVATFDPEKEPFKVGSMDGLLLVMILVFGLVTIVFVALQVLFFVKKREMGDGEDSSIGYQELNGQHLDGGKRV